MTKVRQHGLSLIELMITVAVIVTLAVIGGPPLADTLRNNRLTAQSNELNAGLTRARGEAVARRGWVSLCSSTDAANCRTSSQGLWEGGWIMFVDTNGNGARASTELLIAAARPLPAGMSLRQAGFTNTGFVRFDARGQADSAGTFVLCDARGATRARTLGVNTLGKVVRPVDTDGNGIPQVLSGGNATCP